VKRENQKNLKKRTKHSILIDVFFLITVVLISVYLCDLRFSLNRDYLKPLSEILNNEGNTPFQYRVLVPWLIRGLIGSGLMPWIAQDPLPVIKFIEWLSICLVIITFRYYISLFIRDRLICSIYAFFIVLIIPFNFLLPRDFNFWYTSDMPALVFMNLGLICLYQKRWFPFYLVFFFGTFNRETTCFLTLIFIFTAFRQAKLDHVLKHSIIQLALWTVIKYFLFCYYINNPGTGLFEVKGMYGDKSHLVLNTQYLLDIRNYPIFFSMFGYIWIPVLFCFRWISDNFVRRSLMVFIPFFLGMMVVGNIPELRIFGELIPVVGIAFILLVDRLCRNIYLASPSPGKSPGISGSS